jgi:hypothetical protein
MVTERLPPQAKPAPPSAPPPQGGGQGVSLLKGSIHLLPIEDVAQFVPTQPVQPVKANPLPIFFD